MTEREGQDQLGADTAGEDKKITPLPMDSSDSSDAESEGETYDICFSTQLSTHPYLRKKANNNKPVPQNWRLLEFLCIECIK